MNLACADQIAKAVLYEGYMLYPYRPSSVKNRQRFNFGMLYPPSYGEAHEEASSILTECLIEAQANPILEVRFRFLHLRPQSGGSDATKNGWQVAVEREVGIPAQTIQSFGPGVKTFPFAFAASEASSSTANDAARQEQIKGSVDVEILPLSSQVFKVRVRARNTTPTETPVLDRAEALMRSLISAHVVLGVEQGEFVSLLEPAENLQPLAATCQNVGVWPVLVGEPGQRDTLLASPIILYDYPQIAPESAGDLFDGTEIDEILSLRILALTDEEKREVRESDERARRILERTEAMPAEQFVKLHGAVRGLRPLKETS